MKNWKMNNRTKILSFLFCCATYLAMAQDSTKEEAPPRKSMVIVNYYAINNTVPYFKIETKNKIGKKFESIGGVEVTLYLGSETSPDALIAKVKTNDLGEAVTGIPGSLAPVWKSASAQTILAKATGSKNFDESEAELSITKARIELDTISDGETRTIQIKLLKQDGDHWNPAADVEMKVAVKRLGGDLVVGDEETYTTDSLGMIEAEFGRDSLPGDEKGNLILVAKIDENEELGNLAVEKTVPWGIAMKTTNDFDQRSLWATGNKAPVWLLFMAYSIMIGVWSVIIYLVFQMIRIKKLGTTNSVE
jgi:hypothetical protein